MATTTTAETKNGAPLVRRSNAGKHYGNIIALQGVSLQVSASEVICVLGDNGVVLRYIIQARERGLGVIFITHHPHHAYPVGDRFRLLKRGRNIGYFGKDEVTRDELTALMAGGAELEELSHELERGGGAAAEAAHVIEAEVKELGIEVERTKP
jgi:ABC-type sugar transport system ATPase subunit